MRIIRSIPRDSIPAVDNPEFSSGYGGAPDDDVIVVEPDDGPARAYPTRYLDFHEIVNDRIDDRPVAVTWCPLCGSAVVYDATVGERELTFGVSGKLADDNLVMYDRETDSEWKQSTGECIAGELAGARLSFVTASVTGYRAFRDAHPENLVLDPPGGQSISSGSDRDLGTIDYEEDPFGPYFESDGIGRDAFYDLVGREPDENYRGPRTWSRDDIGPKEVVLGLDLEETVAFPRSHVEAKDGVVQTTVGERDVVAFATSAGLHAFEDPGVAFERTGNREFVGDGTTWDGSTGESTDGRSLARIPGVRAFAFVWQDDHGPDSFYPSP